MIHLFQTVIFVMQLFQLSSGTYSITHKTITPSACSDSTPLQYLIENGKLTIVFNCIEPCKQKYIRLL